MYYKTVTVNISSQYEIQKCINISLVIEQQMYNNDYNITLKQSVRGSQH